MTEKRPRNIHEIINRFDMVFGHKHIDIGISSVSMDHVYLKVIYKKNHRIDPATAWGVCKDNHPGGITDLFAIVSVRLDQPNSTSRPRLILGRDAFRVNSYTMQESNMASQFRQACLDMPASLADHISGLGGILLGRKLHRQAIAEYRHKLEYMTRIANDFARTGAVTSYALSEDTQEGQFRAVMDEIQGLHRIGRYLLFQTNENGRYIENGKPMTGGAAA